jgi:hypothetical protein
MLTSNVARNVKHGNTYVRAEHKPRPPRVEYFDLYLCSGRDRSVRSRAMAGRLCRLVRLRAALSSTVQQTKVSLCGEIIFFW